MKALTVCSLTLCGCKTLYGSDQILLSFRTLLHDETVSLVTQACSMAGVTVAA